MISVIVPTMWKAPHLMHMLPLLQEHSLIGEILIIDNDTSKTNEEIHKYSKVIHLPQRENIFVNPAWNLGYTKSKYDKLCILNDDVIFNIACIDNLYDHINPNNGLLGFSEESYCSFAPEIFDTLVNTGMGVDISLKECDIYQNIQMSGMPHVFYGCVMFLHKSRYFPIPKEFKIYYGDLFIYLLNSFNVNHGEDIAPGLKLITKTYNAVKNYTIEDGLVLTKMSSTVKTSNSQKQIQKEKDVFYDVFKRFGINKADT